LTELDARVSSVFSRLTSDRFTSDPGRSLEDPRLRAARNARLRKGTAPVARRRFAPRAEGLSGPCPNAGSDFPTLLSLAGRASVRLAIILVSSSSSFVFAQPSLVVGWTAGRLSVRAEAASLAEVLGEVGRRTGIGVEGVASLGQEKVSVRFEGLTLREGLEHLLARRDYVVLGNLARPAGPPRLRVIVLERAAPAGPEPAATAEDGESEAPADTQEEGAEVAAAEEEPASEVEALGETLVEDGGEAEEPPAEPVATVAVDSPMAAETGTPAPAAEPPRWESSEEDAIPDAPGRTVEVPEQEPESGVEILGENENTSDEGGGTLDQGAQGKGGRH
jgi:hypothetical protein